MNVPKDAEDCKYAKRDDKATGFGLWHNCKYSGGICHVDYGDPCPYLVTMKDYLADTEPLLSVIAKMLNGLLKRMHKSVILVA